MAGFPIAGARAYVGAAPSAQARRVHMVPLGMQSREMDGDPTDGADHLYADGDQGLPDSGDLGAAERGPVQTELQLFKQDKRRRRQGDAQLIGLQHSRELTRSCWESGDHDSSAVRARQGQARFARHLGDP